MAYIRDMKDMHDGAKSSVETVGGDSKHFLVGRCFSTGLGLVVSVVLLALFL